MNTYRIEYRGNDDQTFSRIVKGYSQTDAIECFEDWSNNSDFHRGVTIVSVTKL